jgi:hypothetical protein
LTTPKRAKASELAFLDNGDILDAAYNAEIKILEPRLVMLIDGQYAPELRGFLATLGRQGPGHVEIVVLSPPLMGA